MQFQVVGQFEIFEPHRNIETVVQTHRLCFSSYVCYVSMWFKQVFLKRVDFKLTHYPISAQAR